MVFQLWALDAAVSRQGLVRDLPEGMAAEHPEGGPMSLKCHFDGDGWLQGPISITHVMTPNHGTGFGTGRGVVMHTEAGYEAGTVATFMNPSAQVSAFFSIGQSGACHQYVPVGRGYTAWSQASGNSTFRGIEDEDRTDPAIPLTSAQITTFAQIFEACSAYDGFPLQVTDDVNGHGLICHGDGGASWGGHYSCPGNVRKAQRGAIVALAKEIRGGGGNTPAVSVKVWVAAGQKSLADLCSSELHNGVSTVLRLTAENSPSAIYTPAMATYLNQVFAADKAHIPAGVIVRYPKASATEAFTSRGDQTLQGLANTWHCECSAVVRTTAEGSPGAEFSGAMATYLDQVFSRSSLHVPAGVHLYYEQ